MLTYYQLFLISNLLLFLIHFITDMISVPLTLMHLTLGSDPGVAGLTPAAVRILSKQNGTLFQKAHLTVLL